MVEITAKLDLDVTCNKCNDGLEITYDERREQLYIDPCETCLENSYIEGEEEGKKNA